MQQERKYSFKVQIVNSTSRFLKTTNSTVQVYISSLQTSILVPINIFHLEYINDMVPSSPTAASSPPMLQAHRQQRSQHLPITRQFPFFHGKASFTTWWPCWLALGSTSAVIISDEEKSAIMPMEGQKQMSIGQGRNFHSGPDSYNGNDPSVCWWQKRESDWIVSTKSQRSDNSSKCNDKEMWKPKDCCHLGMEEKTNTNIDVYSFMVVVPQGTMKLSIAIMLPL